MTDTKRIFNEEGTAAAVSNGANLPSAPVEQQHLPPAQHNPLCARIYYGLGHSEPDSCTCELYALKADLERSNALLREIADELDILKQAGDLGIRQHDLRLVEWSDTHWESLKVWVTAREIAKHLEETEQ